jgi:superfamily II DNA/RNA helicase
VGVGLCCGLASLEEEAQQYERQSDTLLAGLVPIQTGASILVATPGRLRSHLDRRTMNLLSLKFLVLDEMDRLLQQSYHECIPVLLDQYQKTKLAEEEKEARQMGLSPAQFMRPKYKCVDNRLIKLSVSATISNDSGVKTAKLREGFVRTVSGFRSSSSLSGSKDKYELPENLEEFMLVCSKEKKPFALLDLLKKVKRQRTLCFANATEGSELIHTLVSSSQGLGWNCEVYNSKRRNDQRGAALKSFGSHQGQPGEEEKEEEANNKLLICTDGASRGIDLKQVKLVINYDMPTSTKNVSHKREMPVAVSLLCFVQSSS